MKKLNTNLNNIQLPNEDVKKIIEENYYQKSMQKIDNSDVNINHLENIFTNETYYMAMKIVPLLERKVLYLSYIENIRLNDIAKRLKLQKNEVISLRNKAITHFKNNLSTLNKAQIVKKGWKN
jgi:DNA-directed RNA polymerase specialized sigma subunit